MSEMLNDELVDAFFNRARINNQDVFSIKNPQKNIAWVNQTTKEKVIIEYQPDTFNKELIIENSDCSGIVDLLNKYHQAKQQIATLKLEKQMS